MSLNRMFLCSKSKNGLWKIVTKSQVVTKLDVTKSRLHCIRLTKVASGHEKDFLLLRWNFTSKFWSNEGNLKTAQLCFKWCSEKSVWVDLYSYVCYAMMIYGANKPITCVLRKMMVCNRFTQNTKHQIIGNGPDYKVQSY